MFGFHFQQLTFPISLSNQVQTGSLQLMKGDVLEAVRISVHAGASAIPLAPPPFRLIALNDPIATGLGVALPSRATLELIPEISIPYTTVAAVKDVTVSFVHTSTHELPVHLECDETSRDIAWSLDGTTTGQDFDGYVSFVIRRPAVEQGLFGSE